MLYLVLISISLCVFHFTGVNSEFKAHLEDCLISYANEEYIGESEIYLTDDEGVFVNLTFIKIFPENVNIHVKMMGLSMGEYTVPSGFDIEMELCEMVDEPMVVGPILRDIGINPDNCPPKPGFYGHSNYKIDLSKIPDNFPPNQYLASLDAKFNEEIMFTILLYARTF